MKKGALAREAVFTALPCVLADRVTKALALKLPQGGIAAGPFRLACVRNTGVAFGMLGGSGALSAALSAALLALLSWWLFSGRERLRRCRAALLMMLAGGLSNLYDRVFFGGVTDFIEPTFVRFAVFNAADVFVCAGAALFALFRMTVKDDDRIG